MPSLRFNFDEKHFENAAFRKQWRHDNHVIFLTEFPSNTNPKWPVIVPFSNSPSVVWTVNVWCVFRVQFCFQISPAYSGLGLNCNWKDIPLASCVWEIIRPLNLIQLCLWFLRSLSRHPHSLRCISCMKTTGDESGTECQFVQHDDPSVSLLDMSGKKRKHVKWTNNITFLINILTSGNTAKNSHNVTLDKKPSIMPLKNSE